ncbi:B3/4 domain-containing protein [Saccharicrinis sp. FJH62]|uniref:B3/B4 domain-containing protein n=1 Tax=Saccharicrinis sp. FJH62 TaxID=3344657 RepID=UPI0035D47CE7
MKEPVILFQDNLRYAVPNLLLGDIVCTVTNSEYNQELWDEIKAYETELREKLKIESVKHIPTIKATREAYKSCGKDPNRYRPSAEQLNRRILQGKELYHISTLVDLINLVSLKTGYSIGGFDYESVAGELKYGIGQTNEKYEGIGRGKLNIEGLPVLRDELGGIGTPTSDEIRTRIRGNSRLLLMNINAFDGDTDRLNDTINWSVALLKKYVSAEIHFLTVNR